MKTKILLLAGLLSIAFHIKAQNYDRPQKMKKEQIKAEKIAFLTRELSLTSQEAQQFWPLYNEFENKKETLLQERKTLMQQQKNIDELSDKEVENMINKHLAIKQKELALEQEYIEKYKQVLPVKKVAKLMKAEHQFKKYLLQKIKQQHPPKGGPGKPHR